MVQALSRPLEGDEVDVLTDVLKLSVIRDVNIKELLSVVQVWYGYVINCCCL